MVINFEMPTILGILEFMTRTNVIVCYSEQEYCFMCLFFDIYEEKIHNHVS